MCTLRFTWARGAVVVALAATLGACGGKDSTGPGGTDCAAAVDLFPVPVNAATSPFPSIDDSFLVVPFASGFQFSFFGTSYSFVVLNTNGGMTFGSGNDEWDPAIVDVTQPGIAVFWGDLDAGEYGGVTRANQMKYQVCPDSFIVTYTQMQDNDDDTWNNTATVTLEASGKITIQYGAVLSEDIIVGVFDGTHGDDKYMSVQNSYSGYSTNGTGTVLFDYWGLGPDHAGELSNQTIVFNP